VTAAATVPFDRVRTTAPGPLGRLHRLLSPGGILARIRSAGGSLEQGPVDPEDGSGGQPTVEAVSLSPVTGRDTGGFGRVGGVELRRILRGQPRWWYLGAVASIAVPAGVAATGGDTGLARGLLPLVAVWPLFVRSQVGSQTTRYRIRTRILASRYPVGQLLASRYPVGQLLAEWLAGGLVAAGVGSATFVLVALNAGPTALVGVAGAVVFPPSLALVTGLWTGSPRLFEALYLGLWSVGPLNRGFVADFVGVTARGLSTGVPLVFAAVGIGAVAVATHRRRVYRPVL
jgi:hypothetical protein